MISYYLLMVHEGDVILAGLQATIVSSSRGSLSVLTAALHRHPTYEISAKQRLERKFVVFLSKAQKTAVKNVIAGLTKTGFTVLTRLPMVQTVGLEA